MVQEYVADDRQTDHATNNSYIDTSVMPVVVMGQSSLISSKMWVWLGAKNVPRSTLA